MADLPPRAVEMGRLEVVEYMDGFDGSLHPALSQGPTYDIATDRWQYRRSAGPSELYAVPKHRARRTSELKRL